jgi:hypothetical protein
MTFSGYTYKCYFTCQAGCLITQRESQLRPSYEPARRKTNNSFSYQDTVHSNFMHNHVENSAGWIWKVVTNHKNNKKTCSYKHRINTCFHKHGGICAVSFHVNLTESTTSECGAFSPPIPMRSKGYSWIFTWTTRSKTSRSLTHHNWSEKWWRKKQMRINSVQQL